ncbi:hypothetical protein PAPYR_11809 [Paratrimastix pyriformis]|uniref:Uncharacterized protein n=1 Tax=Paratrimastix pyriformis TaxID=342808 RepID=A0ABQ8U6S7_9EUKA|nr:hypothetical protein PAPYR_11809 [Paratrimastix pyriformis]
MARASHRFISASLAWRAGRERQRTPVLYLPPDEAAREILRCHLVRTETFAFMNCLNVRPFPFRKGKVRLPAFSEELGELGCPFERLNETDVGNMPQEITFMDGRRLSEFELVLGYWLGWCAAQLPPAMQDYLMPEHCPYARLWEEMGHHDIPRASKRMLKTVDRELREERRALGGSRLRAPRAAEVRAGQAGHPEGAFQAEPTSEAEAKAAEADDEYEVKACALPPESATEEAQPSSKPVPEPEPKAKPRASQACRRSGRRAVRLKELAKSLGISFSPTKSANLPQISERLAILHASPAMVVILLRVASWIDLTGRGFVPPTQVVTLASPVVQVEWKVLVMQTTRVQTPAPVPIFLPSDEGKEPLLTAPGPSAAGLWRARNPLACPSPSPRMLAPHPYLTDWKPTTTRRRGFGVVCRRLGPPPGPTHLTQVASSPQRPRPGDQPPHRDPGYARPAGPPTPCVCV